MSNLLTARERAHSTILSFIQRETVAHLEVARNAQQRLAIIEAALRDGELLAEVVPIPDDSTTQAANRALREFQTQLEQDIESANEMGHLWQHIALFLFDREYRAGAPAEPTEAAPPA
jgi:hypothetical protein